jgi:hypothetical protein
MLRSYSCAAPAHHPLEPVALLAAVHGLFRHTGRYVASDPGASSANVAIFNHDGGSHTADAR